MAAAEDQRPGAVEGVGKGRRAAAGQHRQQGQACQQGEECGHTRDGHGFGDAHGEGVLSGRLVSGWPQPEQADQSGGRDRGHQHYRMGHQQHHDGGQRGDRRPGSIRSHSAGHAQHGMGDHSHGSGLQSVDPTGLGEVPDPAEAVGEAHQQDHRGHGEGEPSGQHAAESGALQP